MWNEASKSVPFDALCEMLATEILLSASLLARRLLIQAFFQTQGLSGIV